MKKTPVQGQGNAVVFWYNASSKLDSCRRRASAQITMMMHTCVIRLWARAFLLVGALLVAAPQLNAQVTSAPAQASATTSLLDKARALEQRGRMDLAEQTWQQVLLTDPKNTEALAGLARAAKLNNSPALAKSYIERLRAINPNDPNIARIEDMTAGKQDQKSQLQQAAKLAVAGQYAAAMVIYRRVFGSDPPPGDWALAYYETEAATADGRTHAIAGLRALLDKDPSNAQYRIALGRVLTYDPSTREEGREYLASFLKDPKAAEAYRQSLLWDAGNPAMATQIRAYLATHPDPQLTAAVESGHSPSSPPPAVSSAAPATASPAVAVTKAPPSTPTPRMPATTPAASPASTPATEKAKTEPAPEPPPAHTPPTPATAAAKPSAAEPAPARTTLPAQPAADGSARTRAAEMTAYEALNANHIDDAETHFKAILATEPQNPRALAGMGYVRMQQGNFPGAIGFLEQAHQLAPNDKGLASALDTARFWFIMSEGQRAFNDNDLTTAQKRYQAALDLRPNSVEALEGLGSTFVKAQQPSAAVPLFQRAVAADTSSVAGWRGLFTAQVQSGAVPAALATGKQIPPSVHTQLMSDPAFLLSLATAYSSAGETAEAQGALESSLKLPFPAEAKALKADTQLQLAALFASTNHLDRAEDLYAQVVADDHANAPALQSLVRVQHTRGHDADALKTVESMPPPVYEAAMRDTSFEVTVASIYQSQNKLDDAQQLLQNALAQQSDPSKKPSPALQMQLADLYVQRGSPQLAFPIYQQITRDNPERADAWAGLVSVLHTTAHDKEAADQIKTIPAPVRSQLEANPAYLQTVASVYQALGRSREAEPYLNRVEENYAAQSKSAPADVEIQNAWLLFNGMEDDDLYRQLMSLGSRTDLSTEQRKTVQTIWTNWALRRANQASAAGNPRLALAILNAAAHSFPDNPGATKALAIGYVMAGEPQQAVVIYKTQNMSTASSADYQAAIGAALSSGDNKDAEIWLRYALAAYPSDPQILVLGARFEQARGDTSRAIKYYRQSLKAMPPAPAGPKLAAELGLPAPTAPNSLPNSSQPQDLSILLSPDSSSLSSTVPTVPSQPYLPKYSNPLPSPDGSSQAVPPYMSNPDSKSTTAATSGTANPSSQPDVVSTVRTATSQALGQPQYSETPQAYQQQQVARLNQRAAEQSPPTSGSESYGPYVAYIPPPPATPAPAVPDRGVMGQAVVPVQLGDHTPKPVQQETDKTDVLPTPRFAPSARAAELAREQPALDATRAAHIRELQADSAARSGQSHPPSEDSVIVPTQNATYTEPAQQGAAQVAQPATVPGGQFGSIPNTGAQQYPQPRTPPAPSRSTPERNPSTAIAPPAPNPPAPAPAAVAVVTAVTPPPAAPAQTPASPYPPIAYPLGPPPTDAELQARNLPALRGSFGAQAPIPMSPRQQAEGELASLEGSYSGWLGATGIGRYRSGTPGLDRLYDLEAPVEASTVVGRSVRFTAVALPVFLNSGLLNTATFATGNVPYLGTLAANAGTAPSQQFSNGVGGELQLATKQLGIAAGYTPYNFLVHNVTGRLHFSLLGDHLVLFGARDSVKDTQLSYAGLADPGYVNGPVWGGVISTTGGLRLNLGSGKTDFYISGSGGELTGRHVLANTMFQGNTGASFRVREWDGAGALTVGYELSGMHYQYNEAGLSYGQGGYFSPGSYFLAAVPVTFTGRYGMNLHYVISGAVGVQSFEQEAAPFYPLDPVFQKTFVPSNGATCTASTVSINCGYYPLQDSTLFNYSVNAEVSYRFADHWYGGGYLSATNASNFNTASAGFFFRFVFNAQHSPDGYPTGLFRLQGLRPLQIP